MNKTAQGFLGLAIAIVFPAFVFYAGVTFIPARASVVAVEPTYPQEPAILNNDPNCNGVYNSLTGKYEKINRTLCTQDQSQYTAEQITYNQQMDSYNLAVKASQAKAKADDDYNNQVIVYRGFLGLVFGLLGLVALLAVLAVPPLVYGLAAGAGLTLLGAITATFTASTSDLQKLVAGTLIGLFVLLVAMGLIFDRKFIHPPKSDTPLPTIEPQPQPAPAEPLPQPAPVAPVVSQVFEPEKPLESAVVVESQEPTPNAVGPEETAHWVEHNK
jgi:hypothetical protein